MYGLSVYIWEFESGSFFCVAVCVFSCFLIRWTVVLPRKNWFLPLGKEEQFIGTVTAALAFMVGHSSVHCALLVYILQCTSGGRAGQQKIQVGGKVERCHQSTSRSSLGKRVTPTLEKSTKR